MDDRVISSQPEVGLTSEYSGFPDSCVKSSKLFNSSICSDYSIGLFASALIYVAGVIAIAPCL